MILKKKEPILITVHGLGGNPSQFSVLTQHLNSRKVAFTPIHVRLNGHDTFEDFQNTDPDTWGNELIDTINKVQETGQPIHLIGNSMGATLILYHLLSNTFSSKNIISIITVNPFFGPSSKLFYLTYPLSYTISGLICNHKCEYDTQHYHPAWPSAVLRGIFWQVSKFSELLWHHSFQSKTYPPIHVITSAKDHTSDPETSKQYLNSMRKTLCIKNHIFNTNRHLPLEPTSAYDKMTKEEQQMRLNVIKCIATILKN